MPTTPSRFPNRASAPQNQPSENVAVSVLAGAAASIGGMVPLKAIESPLSALTHGMHEDKITSAKGAPANATFFSIFLTLSVSFKLVAAILYVNSIIVSAKFGWLYATLVSYDWHSKTGKNMTGIFRIKKYRTGAILGQAAAYKDYVNSICTMKDLYRGFSQYLGYIMYPATMNLTNFKYTEKMFAFLDILGFERIVNESKSNPKLISRIANMLARSKSIAESSSNIRPAELQVNPSKYIYQAFSDTSVISSPYMSHDDMNFLSFWVVSYQYLMWKEERTFIRGAIVYGDIYEDEDIVFGPALIDAYHLESSKASWPRVLIDKSLLNKTTEIERTRDFLEFIRQDDDNLAYLDYLRELFHLFVIAENKRIIGERKKDFGLPVSLFKDHREAILAQCGNVLREEHRDENKEILRKYLELSKYHNSTIDRLRQVTNDLANNNGLICEFFEDQKKFIEAKKTGVVYKPEYSAEEHPEQSDMLTILTAALNRVIENPPPDILETSGIVIIGQTKNAEQGRVIRALSREAPKALSALEKTLQESMIDTYNLGLNV